MNTTRTPAQLASNAARSAETQAYAESMRVHLLAVMEHGEITDRKIASLFNRKGLRTQAGGRWIGSAVTVLRGRLGVRKPPAVVSLKSDEVT